MSAIKKHIGELILSWDRGLTDEQREKADKLPIERLMDGFYVLAVTAIEEEREACAKSAEEIECSDGVAFICGDEPMTARRSVSEIIREQRGERK